MSREHLLLRELGMLHLNFGGWTWVSYRATQVLHSKFHILQDNLSVIKGHVKRAPAALFQRISTLVPDLGTWNSVCFTGISEVGTWHLVEQHKPHTLDSIFYKTS
ncbi:hypothetical protein CY34DRAFT_19313 [Suillus luteus UH-Slu-Lm8-n1]|uniref:Uncharacterized protein n=1 Tax=Suillus luteus UH-Slu-Lm8-n1 TaxID=930992 RepID=A0A0D0ACS7_9AGAM|nr:hypothetical protein CY34DRAFT_19313 [Suillus luteus UH-Slu-Lm8-n1]